MLERRFELSHDQARALLAAGEREAGRAAELFHLTRIINERLSFERRIELVEMLWEVAYADGVLDQYEDSLLRRVSGLIYIYPIVSAVWRGSVFSGGWDSTRRRDPSRRTEPAVEVQEKKSPP